jgi:hypothetical protein
MTKLKNILGGIVVAILIFISMGLVWLIDIMPWDR